MAFIHNGVGRTLMFFPKRGRPWCRYWTLRGRRHGVNWAPLKPDLHQVQEADWRRRWMNRDHCGGATDRSCPDGCPCRACGC
jgi:hypothetical protein